MRGITMATIKYIILLALIALMMVGCSEEMDRTAKLVQFKILQIDSCEYLRIEGYYGFAHKGNCRFCKERRQKELEELVIKLKEK
jgi:hypothetical protein